MAQAFHYYDRTALIERLSTGLKRHRQEVVFLVGAPLSAPLQPGGPGVPGVEGIIDLIRDEFAGEPAQLSVLDEELKDAGAKRYQIAFVFLQGRRGQQAANEIVRTAVRAARAPEAVYVGSNFDYGPDEACRLMDTDLGGWALSPGTESLGRLAAAYPGIFGRSILTTNFDPLIEVAIRRSGGQYFRTTLHADGNLAQTEGSGCHVIHLHGYWYGSDTLHTPRQLGQARPRLKASLASLLRDKLVVVCAYSGWDDAFTDAMMEVVRDDAARPEVIWTFLSPEPGLDDSLSSRLGPGIDRGRVTLYGGIDCHQLFPTLYDSWQQMEVGKAAPAIPQSNSVRVNADLREKIEAKAVMPSVIEGDDEDRPPVVEIFVGRSDELKQVEESNVRAVFFTGIGGQGKSTLASRYFADCQRNHSFSFFVWRDCKEESERFENQLASVVEKLSGGSIRGEDLVKQTTTSIVQILIKLIGDLDVLFVFDNIDHYVNLESGKMFGSPDIFIEALLQSKSNSRAVFTCRPSVNYSHPLALSCRLEGIDLQSAQRLFKERGAVAKANEIEDAHHLTDGHAFWLDLLAIQVVKRSPVVSLTSLVTEIRTGGGLLPQATLNSIWTTLKEREQVVLRAMAETVKPDTEAEIGDYLRHKINYNKVIKALKALRALNLIVVKKRHNASDVLELHPLVRQFIRSSFPMEERSAFIHAIISVYKLFIGNHRSELLHRPSLSLLQYWTQNAELDIAARRFADAFLTLADASNAFTSSAYGREFCRIARILFTEVNWVTEHRKFKKFEEVFRAHTRLLSYLGEHDEVDALLGTYEKTLPEKDGRYINYCEMRSSSKWVRGDFNAAVEWGRAGQKLKAASDVDIESDISHTLALAERDAGRPEAALPVFLDGQSLAEVTDPEELDERRGGAHYGNVGRCLHFMGQIDSALICYQKSALLIEKDTMNEHILNQGYIRAWIGELLVAREQFTLGAAFFRAAFLKWEQTYPMKAATVLQLSKQVRERASGSPSIDDGSVEKTFLDWILGRSLD